MNSDEILAVLRLQATKNVGDIIAKKLIRTIGSAEGVFKENRNHLKKINGIGDYIVSELIKPTYQELAEKELLQIKSNNIQYNYFLNDDYPDRLKQCVDSPILLFKDGSIDLKKSKIISIIGTRNITSYGKGFIKEFIEDIKEFNPIIVSGFAYGCDIEAHKSAIENNLQTIAVLAHGLNLIYPKIHKQYINSVNKNGGFLTEFWYNEQPLRNNFLKRNRIVAGISEATIIIESAKKGGSLVTADIANSYNREVFAVPGRAGDYYSKGCNNLIKKHGANILTSANDLINLLNWDIGTPKKLTVRQPSLFLDLNENEQKIYDYLQQNNKQTLDDIAINCNIPIYKLSSILTTMEIKGTIQSLPGKLFEI